MNDTIGIIILGIVVIAQAVERYFFGKDMSQKLQDCIKAVMSRDINEYIAATTQPKKKKEPEGEPDEVELTNADDATFTKAIAQM